MLLVNLTDSVVLYVASVLKVPGCSFKFSPTNKPVSFLCTSLVIQSVLRGVPDFFNTSTVVDLFGWLSAQLNPLSSFTCLQQHYVGEPLLLYHYHTCMFPSNTHIQPALNLSHIRFIKFDTQQPTQTQLLDCKTTTL